MSEWHFQWISPGRSPWSTGALQLVDPEACAVIDQAAMWADQGWVVGELAVETEDDLVTVRRAAELVVGRSTRTIWAWAREHPEVVGHRRPIMVRVGPRCGATVAYERARRASGRPATGRRCRVSTVGALP